MKVLGTFLKSFKKHLSFKEILCIIYTLWLLSNHFLMMESNLKCDDAGDDENGKRNFGNTLDFPR